MKLIYIACLVLISQTVFSQQNDPKSKENPSLYALSVNGKTTKCYNKVIKVRSALLRSFSDYVSHLNKGEDYKILKKEFEYLTTAEISIDSAKDECFNAKKMKKYLKEPVKFSSTCKSIIEFSPVIYSSDGTKAFFVKLESASDMVISENGWLLSKEQGQWKRVKSLTLHYH